MANKNLSQLVVEEAAKPQGINRFEAYHNIGDSCLNSTISRLCKQGYVFRKEWERVTNRNGGKTACMRYWLIQRPEHNKAKNNATTSQD